MRKRITSLLVGLGLTLASFCLRAEESDIAVALKHAEAATKASDEAIVEHAEAAKAHAKAADEHLDAGIQSLEAAIEHGKMGHADMAKKSAEESVAHLKAVR